ncbi:phosphotransferase [Microbacterium sp.]|uniref:phosphotransferase n=1 Tax=Microbacterium sp. TaxID=51671 RepID=UPI0039E261E7
MARSPFTLAASVSSALAQVSVVRVAALTEGAAGRYDSAVATLDDGRSVVVRVPTDAEADMELRAEMHALRALTPGVRGVLPFEAPEVLGESSVGGALALVQTMLTGYRVDGAHIPAGPGVATAIATAIADIHDLPHTVVRDGGLPLRSSGQLRDEAERLLDRAEATGHLPFGLLRRWSQALATEPLWRFETTVTLGGADPASFVLTDTDGVPAVTGLLAWGGLSVGDPAIDLRWTAAAPACRDDVLAAYAARTGRGLDPLLSARARLYAELEFAKWLVHGHGAGSESVVADAVGLLTSLDESVRDEPLFTRTDVDVDDALALLGRVPDSAAELVDTSMQTDAYDPATMSAALPSEPPTGDRASHAHISTAPIELSDWSPQSAEAESDQAAQNALRRWTESA